MCKVKTGADVRTNADLQNLVTSAILRQPKPFTRKEVMDQVIGKLADSPYASEEERVRSTCTHTIMFMELSGSLRSTGDRRYRLTLPFPSYNRSLAGAQAFPK